MNSIVDFPEEIIDIIKDFLWPNIDSQKKIFYSILKENKYHGLYRFFDSYS